MLLDLQKRLTEVGRIRLGEKVAMQRGGTRPSKLSTFRLTSADRHRLDAAAEIYGGEVKPWDDKFEIVTDADALDIAVLPGQSISQYWELWGKSTGRQRDRVVCLRRCDGNTEMLSDSPCKCPADYDERREDAKKGGACRPTTRLSVLLRRVPGIGVWRLETHGFYAAIELPATAQLLERITAERNMPVNARLRLDQRNSVMQNGETASYVVPVIDIDMALDEMKRAPAIEAPVVREITTARGQLAPADDRPDPTAAVAEMNQPAKRGRSRTPELKSAAIEPTQTRIAVDDGEGPAVAPVPPTPGAQPQRRGRVTAPANPAPSEQPPDDGGAMKPDQFIAMRCREAGLDDDQRHQLILKWTDGRTNSAKEVKAAEMSGLLRLIDGIKDGRLILKDDGTVEPVL